MSDAQDFRPSAGKIPCVGGPLDGQERELIGTILITCTDEPKKGIVRHHYHLVRNRITDGLKWYHENAEVPC